MHTFNKALTSRYESQFWVPSTKSSAPLTGRPEISPSCLTTSLIYSGSALRPVPTAVAPIFTVSMCSLALVKRLISLPTTAACALNSWPNLIGTASCKWVLPILIIPSNSFAFLSIISCISFITAINSSSSIAIVKCAAVGKESFVLWAILTWEFGEITL